MSMKTKRHHGGEEGGGGGHETGGMMRWLITYADMITLLLALFIMLYAMSYMDLQKFQALAKEFKVVFQGSGGGILEGGKGVLKQGAPESQRPMLITLLPGQKPSLTEEQKIVEKYIEGSGLEGKVLVSREERGLVISLLTDGIFFELGTADLSEQAKKVLKDLTPMLIKSDRPIRVEGHTCDLPIRTSRFPSNWELSTIRATNVLKFLTSLGVPPSRLSAVGYGEYHPKVSNTSEENRRLNRRVDIVLLSDEAKKIEPTYHKTFIKGGKNRE